MAAQTAVPSAVPPYILRVSSGALYSSNKRTASNCPRLAAQCRAFSPVPFPASASTPCLSSISATLVKPLKQAQVKASARTFGSLIQIPDVLNAQLPALVEALGKANETGDLYAQAAGQDLLVIEEAA